MNNAEDRFYRGHLVRVRRGALTGVIRGPSGRELPFSAEHLRILGTDRGFEALQEGQVVGFDVGRTSRGLCVTTIRVYDAST